MKDFARAAIIRALRTFFQAFIANIGTTAITLDSVKWEFALSASALAMILSLCTSIATGLPEAEG